MHKRFFSNTRLHHAVEDNNDGQTNINELPCRSELSEKYKWQLQDIYETEDLWKADYEKLKNTFIPQMAQYKKKCTASPQILADCMQNRDEIGVLCGKLFAFARMHRDENTADAKYQAMTDQTETLLAQAGAATAFIEPEILAMPSETLDAFCQQEKRLHQYRFYFQDLARQKAHILSAAEEEILSHVTEVAQSAENIFNMLAHADMEFPETIDENGNNVKLSEGRYALFIHSNQSQVRQQAFSKLFTTYNQFRNTFAATLSGSVKKNIFFARTRKYPSAIEASLEADNVPISVYENLIATVNKNLKPLHKYVSLKKKILKLPEIHMYDLYTPLAPETKGNIPYETAREMVKTALSPLGTAYLDILENGFHAGWVDVYENKGKQTGAYSWGCYDIHPFVLLNYQNQYDDVSTVAHEMGHAIHSYYSQENQPYTTSSYTTFSAEVASTTNEILLLDHMLHNATDQKQKAYLLNQYLEQVRATVFRQTMFAEFEMTLYKNAETNQPVTADELDAIWLALNEKYYGPEIIVDKEIAVEWARIPHFYWDFYVYQYVTGYAAATTLAAKIRTEGLPAQEKYITFLKSGGSDYSLNLLKAAGVDMSSPQPLEITIAKFGTKLEELENLLNSLDNT